MPTGAKLVSVGWDFSCSKMKAGDVMMLFDGTSWMGLAWADPASHAVLGTLGKMLHAST